MTGRPKAQRIHIFLKEALPSLPRILVSLIALHVMKFLKLDMLALGTRDIWHKTFLCTGLLTCVIDIVAFMSQDVGAYLAASEEQQFDLVIAAETLQYLGPLESVFADAFKVLKPGGHISFTVDRRELEGAEGGEEREPRKQQVGGQEDLKVLFVVRSWRAGD